MGASERESQRNPTANASWKMESAIISYQQPQISGRSEQQELRRKKGSQQDTETKLNREEKEQTPTRKPRKEHWKRALSQENKGEIRTWVVVVGNR